MNVYTRYTCKWQIFGNVRNCHLLPIIFTLDLPSYLIVTVSTSEKEEFEHLVNTESRPLDVVAIYAPKTDPHLAIKILLHTRKKILCSVKNPWSGKTVGKWQWEMLLFATSQKRQDIKCHIFIDIDNIWTRFSTMERMCGDRSNSNRSFNINWSV